MLARMGITAALACVASGLVFAQDSLTFELRLGRVRYCEDYGTRSIRVHFWIDARNEGSVAAVAPALVNPSRITIQPIGDSDRPQELHFPQLPITPEKALRELRGEGGGVLSIPRGEDRSIVGPDLVFWPGPIEAPEAGAGARRDTLVVLNLGQKYRLEAEVALFSADLQRFWVDRGFLVRAKATATAELSIPAEVKWGACPGEPRLILNKK